MSPSFYLIKDFTDVLLHA